MTDCKARDSGMVCTKTSPHPGERHTCDFGTGTYTWGYELTDGEREILARELPAIGRMLTEILDDHPELLSDADRADIAEDQHHVRLADGNEDHL